jgi:hypothetical protein
MHIGEQDITSTFCALLLRLLLHAGAFFMQRVLPDRWLVEVQAGDCKAC